MTSLKTLIDTSTEITRSKGFDLSMHATMIAQMAGETAEALKHVTPSGDHMTDHFCCSLKMISDQFEAYRCIAATGHKDQSTVLEVEPMLKELADQVLRVFSYVGANGWRDLFVASLLEKLNENRDRPPLHGKGF